MVVKPKVTPPSKKDKQKHNEDSGKGKINGIGRYYGKTAIVKGDLKAKKLFPTQDDKTEEGDKNKDINKGNNTIEREYEELTEQEKELGKTRSTQEDEDDSLENED